ncbi:MAG TPA: RDD family protein [Tenuifilaceae bacterium]|nr:RDD family protein [Tenuifilaceae bacterium]HQB79317.1 RDD family protein [Tenuifilaceae bacterium]
MEQENKEIKYAGFWLRVAAYLIDSLVMSAGGLLIAIPVIIGIVGFAVGLEGVENPEDFLESGRWMYVGGIIGLILLASLLGLVMGWLYYALMESSKYGGTLGKIAVGIKVVDMNGNKVTFGKATGRYFSRIVTNMTLFVGYIMAGFTEKKQALHDIIAGCLVITR